MSAVVPVRLSRDERKALERLIAGADITHPVIFAVLIALARQRPELVEATRHKAGNGMWFTEFHITEAGRAAVAGQRKRKGGAS